MVSSMKLKLEDNLNLAASLRLTAFKEVSFSRGDKRAKRCGHTKEESNTDSYDGASTSMTALEDAREEEDKEEEEREGEERGT